MTSQMRRIWIAAVVCLSCAMGCTEREMQALDAGRDGGRAFDGGRDAGSDAGGDDAGSDDAGSDDAGPGDGGQDAGTAEDAGSDGGRADAAIDGGSTDAGTPDSGSVDAGDPAPIIDGVLGPLEWRGATVVSDTTATAWTGSELRALRALVRPEGLYLAIDGAIEGGNAIAVYVDRDRGAPEGVALSSLTDSGGALDNALTAGFTTPADVRPDLAWGTLDLARTGASADDRMGWRDLARGTPADLYWITDAQSACGASSCETFLPRSSLDFGGVTAPRTVAIFARITNHDGTASPNQTLPTDDPAMPRVVGVLVELSEP